MLTKIMLGLLVWGITIGYGFIIFKPHEKYEGENLDETCGIFMLFIFSLFSFALTLHLIINKG